MRLRDYFDPGSIDLDLTGTTKDAVFTDMVRLLRVDDRAQNTLLRLVQRREQLGSTGIGRGVAVPHCRSLAVSRLRIAFGRHRTGIEYDAIDRRPVTSIFLIAAPPTEVANQYLAVLAQIAQLVKEPDAPERLARLETVEDFFGFLDQRAG
jgi:mannitol/fructose-specific phosphotransferase system IIA component (Ntr-type)